MDVLKVVAEGLTTSFRYPHFVQGVHPTFEMPPPATIYGHICSAVGDLIPSDTTLFAYHFTYDAKFEDYEHLHFYPSKSGKSPINPFKREMLFNPRLTLYLSNTDLEPYFHNPHYPVVLGRSQDLMMYTNVERITLEQRDITFYEGTLIPLHLAAFIGGRFVAVTMPRFIDEERRPIWDQFGVLHDRVEFPSDSTLQFSEVPIEIWVDPSQEDAKHPYKNLQRGIIWHSWEVARAHYST